MDIPVRALPPATDSGRPVRMTHPISPRLQRLRFLSWLLDQCVPLPFGMRVGIDPIIGLVPGVGDAVMTTASLYMVYEAARLGLRKRVLARMLLNVLLEALAGSVPLLGDVFDAVWKANVRNLRLVEKHYHPLTPERPAHRIAGWFALILLALLAVIVVAFYLVLQAIYWVISSIATV